MATIIKRRAKDGSIHYLVRVRKKGTLPQNATFQKLADARNWAQTVEASLIYGQHNPLPKHHTLSELVERYIRNVLPHKRPSTIWDQERQLLWWKEQLGTLYVTEITPAILVEHRDKLGKHRSSATVNRYLAVLSHSFTVAVKEWQWMDSNPLSRVTRLKEPRGRTRFLSDQERPRLLETCKASRNPYLYTVVVLALSTGARRGELLGLQWSDIDLKRGALIFRETKNGQVRTVPLTGKALELLSQSRGTGLVFPTGIREAFESALRRAGIGNFRFHDLRHTFASYLAMSGASLSELAEALGHKTLSMVKRYTHLTEGHTRQVVARMNTAIFKD